jgi:hypothetical protein
MNNFNFSYRIIIPFAAAVISHEAASERIKQRGTVKK